MMRDSMRLMSKVTFSTGFFAFIASNGWHIRINRQCGGSKNT